MATTSTILDQQPSTSSGITLLVSLPSLSPEAMEAILGTLAEAFSGMNVTVATPDAPPENAPLRVLGYMPAAPPPSSWTLTAADFLNAHDLAITHRASAILLLGDEAQTLEVQALRGLAEGVLVSQCDLAVARYALPARAGLVNSAILYPISRALFGASSRFPLAVDLGLSARMAERLATSAQRFTAANQMDAMIWPVAEAAVAGFTITQVDTGPRLLPQPPVPDLNVVLAQVTGSLFADVDAKAAYWQRSRVALAARPPGGLASALAAQADVQIPDVQPMIEAFRLAYGNLSEIWSLVLPPHSLLGLKRLSVMPPETFLMPDSLWARVVYDFLLAFRLRTINRGHLLGALTPLYLAWVASHILQTGAANQNGAGNAAERHIEALAAAFEADKPYLVSRWRWPDRFNP